MAIFSAIGAAIAGALFAGSTLAATLIGGALAFGAQLGLSYLKRPKKRTYSAVQGETQFGGDIPVNTLYGIGKTKGQRAFYAKFGSGNKYNAEVFLLANGWCDGLEPYVYFYGKKHDLVTRAIIGNEVAHYGVSEFTSGGNHLFSIRFYDGRPGQSYDAKLVNDASGLGQTWKTTSVAAGLCYVIVEREYNGDVFTSGKPDIEFVLRGLREYDPRKDSTIAGGSGSQRLNDPATWVHTLNPAVHRFNYQLGLRALVSGRTLIGEGKSIGQLDLGTYFTAMNVCDSIREGKPTYQCSIFVSGDDDHTEILKEFDDAMAGYGINRRGLSGVIPGAPQIPVMEITEDDLPIDRPKDIQFRKSAFDRYNHLSGQFTSVEDMWNPQSLTPVYVNADITADGRNRQATNDFLQVTDPDIAQYLLNIRYRQNRKGGTATLPVSRRVGLKVQEGEWVTWRDRTWMISEWSVDEQFRFTLKLTETGADIYDDGDILPGPVIIPPTPLINPSLLTTVANFNVEAGLIAGANGEEVPALEFTWTPPEDPTIVAVRIQYQIDGETQIFDAQSSQPESGKYITTDKVVGGKIYNARATITTVPDRLKTYTPWVTTADPTAAFSIPVYLKNIQKEVKDQFSKIFAEIGEEQTPILERLLTSEQLNAVSTEIMRRELSRQVDNASASFTEEITVVANDLVAAVSQVTTLEADYEANKSAVTSELAAISTDVDALSTTTTSLTASVNDLSVSGKVKFTLAANQSGVDARYSVAIRSSTSVAYKETGFFLELYTVSGVQRSRFAILADQFVVSDGSAYTLPLVYESGVLTLQNVRVQWANIDDAVINNLVVGTSNIAAGAVTKQVSFSNNTGVNSPVSSTTNENGGTQNWYSIASVTLEHGQNSPPVLIFSSFKASGVARHKTVRLLNVSTGLEIMRWGILTSDSSIWLLYLDEGWSGLTIDQPDPTRNSSTYRLESVMVGGSSSSEASAINRRMVALSLLR